MTMGRERGRTRQGHQRARRGLLGWSLLLLAGGALGGCNDLFGNPNPGEFAMGGAGGSGGADGDGGETNDGTDDSGGAAGSGFDGDGGTGGSASGGSASGGSESDGSGGTGGASGGGAPGGGGSSGGGTTSGGGSGGAGSGGVGNEGEPCTQDGAFACEDFDQRERLECVEGKWTSIAQCSTSERCDTRASNAGQCETIVSACASVAPGAAVACSGNTPQECGVDRVTLEDTVACGQDTGCLDGECEPILAECAGHDAGDPVCAAAGSEAFECGPNLVTKEDVQACEHWCSLGACVNPPSCVGLAATCGSTGDQDCCASPLVTGGMFDRGTDANYPATVDRFRLDAYEVTVGRFRKFKAAWDGGWRPESGAGRHTHLNGGAGLVATEGGHEPGWDVAWEANVDTSDAARSDDEATWTTSPLSNETRPINYLNWYDSAAFCIWDGGFLASQAEWEYAAAGGSEERTYPWGDEAPTEDLAVYDCLSAGACTLAYILDVGSKPDGDGLYEQSDLAGSLREWVLDWHAASLTTPCENCTNVTPSLERGLLGGSWNVNATNLLVANRHSREPIERDYGLGTRCARAP